MVRDFIIYLLAFFNIYLIIYYLFFLKKEGPETGEGVKNWDGTRQDEIP